MNLSSKVNYGLHNGIMCYYTLPAKNPGPNQTLSARTWGTIEELNNFIADVERCNAMLEEAAPYWEFMDTYGFSYDLSSFIKFDTDTMSFVWNGYVDEITMAVAKNTHGNNLLFDALYEIDALNLSNHEFGKGYRGYNATNFPQYIDPEDVPGDSCYVYSSIPSFEPFGNGVSHYTADTTLPLTHHHDYISHLVKEELAKRP